VCLCDDGDREAEVAAFAARLAARSPRRYKLAVHPRNRGISAATRSALALASGEACAFVDSDDVLHPRALEAIAAAFARGPDVDVVYTDHDTLTAWGHRLRPVSKPGWSPELLANVNYVNHLLAVRRACLERCEPFDDAVAGAQDWDACLRLARAARRVVHVPLVTYHWRARPGSMAGDARAKPWALRSAQAVREAHARALDPRLELAHSGAGGGRLALRPGAEPRLLVVHVGPGGAPPAPSPDGGAAAPLAYAGDTREARVAADGPRALAAALDGACADLADDDLALFVVGGLARPEGDAGAMAAYAVQRAVGCVHPFRPDGVRFAYSLDRVGARLVPLDRPRGTFSRYTGNVLAGPFHGLMVRGATLRRAGGFERCLGAAAPAAALDPNAFGALLGLRCLELGLRNVAVRETVCRARPGPLALPLLPDVDPYLLFAHVRRASRARAGRSRGGAGVPWGRGRGRPRPAPGRGGPCGGGAFGATLRDRTGRGSRREPAAGPVAPPCPPTRPPL
jgi:hypothetical protein